MTKQSQNFEALELHDGICANNGTNRISPQVDQDESNAPVFIKNREGEPGLLFSGGGAPPG